MEDIKGRSERCSIAYYLILLFWYSGSKMAFGHYSLDSPFIKYKITKFNMH